MTVKKDAFFEATQKALDRLTDIYDLVWPIDVSLRYMRKKVTEFASQSTERLQPDDYVQMFDPEERTHGVNYERAFVYSGRNESERQRNELKLEAAQQENLAWMLLANTIPVYEQWWKDLANEVGFLGMNEDAMEFPTDPMNSNKKGIKQLLSELTSTESTVFKDVFYDLYSTKRNHCNDIDELNRSMYLFRLFKEIRNCYMHSGTVVTNVRCDPSSHDPWITVAYRNYVQNVVIPSSATNVLGIEELPVFPVGFNPVVNSVLHITLRGVVGFSNVLRRIMLTVDSELIRSQTTETYFLSKWSNLVVPGDNRIKMPINVETISLVKRILNSETVPTIEAENAKRSFEQGLHKAVQKYEYDCAINLLSETRLLTPGEVKSRTLPLTSPVNQYGVKVNNVLVPFLKTHNIIIVPTV